MANEKQVIRALTEPSIILDDIQSTDVEDGTSPDFGSPSSPTKYSKQYGGVFPLIQINEKVFESGQIIDLRIYSSGDLPFATATFLVKDKSFYSTSFPKDGDLMSVFIRSKDDGFTPIRNDYEISNISINSDPGGGELSYDEMTVTGKLRVPGYSAVKCFSKKGSSFDVMLETATDLNLGFATNEVDTSDQQTWICPLVKTKDFLNQTTFSAWKDEKSFFTYFIDHYYYLNFVNVEPFYGEELEVDEALVLDLLTNDYGKDSSQGQALTKNVLSNWDEVSGTPFYINHYSLINNSAAINLTHGYKRFARYYDAYIQEDQSIYVDPMTTEGAENDKILLKGRPNEDFYLSEVETKWMGVQYGENGENSHEKLNYSKIHNFQNLIHLKKVGLKVSLAGINVNLRRMQTVPVVIVIKKDYTRKRINEPIDESDQSSIPNEDEPDRTKSALSFEETPITVDKTISGSYVIHDMTIIYEQGNFRQECTLYRREWPTPPQTH
jgi:hypothetical protein